MQTKLGDTLNHAADELDDNLQKTNKKFREVHKHATELNQTHILFLDQAHSKDKGTTEKIERTLRLRIER